MSDRIELKRVVAASPERIFKAWLSGDEHARMTGGEQATYEADGTFTTWDGYIFGRTLEQQPFSRFLQSWRSTEFPEGHADSRLEVTLREVDGGTEVTLVHDGIPDGQGQSYESGWVEHYFEPMDEYFASAGAKLREAGEKVSEAAHAAGEALDAVGEKVDEAIEAVSHAGAEAKKSAQRAAKQASSAARTVKKKATAAASAVKKLVQKAKKKLGVKKKAAPKKAKPAAKKAKAKRPAKKKAAPKKKPARRGKR
ncbi:MAG: SRPBCC domain-containing protein [Myxococcaceae bacterium]|nr:SRPBCC domain-containing protein [Myxococcaceae bacterium]